MPGPRTAYRQWRQRRAFYQRLRGVWIDVGAHHGERTLLWAKANPHLTVYAFEPNLDAALKIMARLPNYHVLPLAVSPTDGYVQFHRNELETTSSLLPLDRAALTEWKGGERFGETTTYTVPSVRLDTFLKQAGIETVDYLKIDAQGADLDVVRSLGARMDSVKKLEIEVTVIDRPVYQGQPQADAVLAAMTDMGFRRIAAESQTYDQEQNWTFVRA